MIVKDPKLNPNSISASPDWLQDGEQPSGATAGQAVLAEGSEPPTVSPEVKRFYEGHRAAMLEWVKQHKNTNFPVIEKDGKLYWINRKLRRKKKHV